MALKFTKLATLTDKAVCVSESPATMGLDESPTQQAHGPGSNDNMSADGTQVHSEPIDVVPTDVVPAVTQSTLDEPDDLPGIVDDEQCDVDQIARDEQTEDAVAESFVSRNCDRLRFDHDKQCWFIWNGTRWEEDKTRSVFHSARHHARGLRDGRSRMATRKATEGVEIMASRDHRVAVASDHWDRDPWLLGTPGGYVDLKTGMLREPDPKVLVTKLAAVAPTQKGTPCPSFTKFLNEVTGGDEGLKRYLQQHAGYCLTGLTKEHVVLFIYGPGGNGKSVLQDAIVAIMGDYAKTAAMDTFSTSRHQDHPTEIATLCGARLVAASETGQGQRWNMARINQLTGGDRVTARFMRKDPFTFRPQFKAIFVGNHKPELGTVNDAARRRIVIVPFLYKPQEPDKNLPEKLKAEYPAILSWMIEGCLDWQKNGLVLPDVIKQATDDYFEGEDVFGRWIVEKCQIGPDLKTKASDLYKSWKEFADANGEHPGSSKSLAEMLKQRGFKSKKSGGTVYLGIGLNPISPPDFSKDL